ncbi:tRNA threonylcarbamoyladenosine dehydratase [Haloferula sargassicola]|uniref:tRNA threonylcarbamoyladenosine dehydratase n=1 Tax=Haloferula sargassicola TaxID=490096 RepID=A0ABP9UTI3_9BACT
MSAAHDRLSGIIRLYGRDAFEKFLSSTVLVAGIGGVGSWVAESLARSGIGHLILVDPDDLCVTNTNRQIHALDGNFGRAKVDAMADRLRAIHPEIRITPVASFYSERTSDEILGLGPDAVVDAIDSLRAKCHLLAACRQRQLPTITSGAAGGRTDPTRLRVDDLSRSGRDALLASVRRKLRDEHGFPPAASKGDPEPFGIQAVFSDERPVYPTCEGGTSHERPANLPGAIGCDAGYGSCTQVTAAFGLVCASRILDLLR